MSAQHEVDETRRRRLQELVGVTNGIAPADGVEVPDYAAALEVGDLIGFEDPRDGERYVRAVVGFSTDGRWPGQPVVQTPDAVQRGRLDSHRLAVPEHWMLSPAEVDDGE